MNKRIKKFKNERKKKKLILLLIFICFLFLMTGFVVIDKNFYKIIGENQSDFKKIMFEIKGKF